MNCNITAEKEVIPVKYIKTKCRIDTNKINNNSNILDEFQKIIPIVFLEKQYKKLHNNSNKLYDFEICECMETKCHVLHVSESFLNWIRKNYKQYNKIMQPYNS